METTFRPGSIFENRYEILCVAGSGGMGTVYKARQTDLNRLLAIKILDHAQTLDLESQARFEREAKSLAHLSHIHIAQFYGFGVTNAGIHYFLMEYVEGNSLAVLLSRNGHFDIRRVLRVALQISSTMAYAHKNGVIHRDLKPNNIIISDNPETDFVKVVDFGLARLEDEPTADGQKLTVTGSLIGTPGYMSPEQCLGRKVDARADVYALGCIIYEMLSGHPPFEADNAVALIHKHAFEKPAPISEKLNSTLPEGFEECINKCLEKDPNDRFQSMSDLAQVLQDISLDEAPSQKKTVKTKVASHIAISLGIIALASVIALLWLNSDAGSGSRAKFSLSRDASLKNGALWLIESERLRKKGDIKTANSIAEVVERELKLDTGSVQASADLRIELASDLLSRGHSELAAAFAAKALSDFDGSANARTRWSLKSLDLINKASQLLLKSHSAISNREQNQIIHLDSLAGASELALGNSSLNELALSFFDSKKLEQRIISDVSKIFGLLSLRDKFDIKQGQYDKFDRDFNESEQLLAQATKTTSIIELCHSDFRLLIENGEASRAAKIEEKIELILSKIPDQRKSQFADAVANAAMNEVMLENVPSAEKLARIALDWRHPSDNHTEEKTLFVMCRVKDLTKSADTEKSYHELLRKLHTKTIDHISPLLNMNSLTLGEQKIKGQDEILVAEVGAAYATFLAKQKRVDEAISLINEELERSKQSKFKLASRFKLLRALALIYAGQRDLPKARKILDTVKQESQDDPAEVSVMEIADLQKKIEAED